MKKRNKYTVKHMAIHESKLQLKAYKPNYEMHRQKWVFHNYDDDFWPSVPHGHSMDNKYKH